MAKKALLIFVRHPELGKVKTRLAKGVGEQKALQIYQSLIAHTQQVASSSNVQCFVFYAQELVADDLWHTPPFIKFAQQGKDLGERMANAFATVFAQGYEHACIIGSDCPIIEKEHIQQAFSQLHRHQVVIGPSQDGGYYLLGLSQPQSSLFQHIEWSTSSVFQRTLSIAQSLSLSIHILPTLFDIDTQEDWETYMQNKEK